MRVYDADQNETHMHSNKQGFLRSGIPQKNRRKRDIWVNYSKEFCFLFHLPSQSDYNQINRENRSLKLLKQLNEIGKRSRINVEIKSKGRNGKKLLDF
jgi:hypothetical protein